MVVPKKFRLTEMSIRCLIISHAFNMDGRAASQTITDKIPYLVEMGWKIHVLSAVTGQKDNRFPHARLWALGPSAFRFDFRHWCALRFGRGWRYRIATVGVSLLLAPLIALERTILGLSSQWSWAISAALVGSLWHRKYHFDVIYSTGGAWSAHLGGWWLKKFLRLPWIVEIHDPLIERENRDVVGLCSRASREERARANLEKIICNKSNLCWWFTEGALGFAKTRNPSMGDRGFSILPGAPEPRYRASYSPSDKMKIGYFGSLSNTRSLSHLIEAITEFFNQFPDCREKIELNIYGGGLDEASSTILLANGLQNIVFSHGRLEYDPVTGLTGRDQISKLMQQSDYLLILHGEHIACSEYIPSKLYEYWWAQRPILALVHENIQLRKLITDLSDQNIICDSIASQGEYILMMKRAWMQWRAGSIQHFKTSMSPLTPEKGARQIVERVTAELGLGSR